MNYGIYDTEGKAWLGNEKGPITFDDRQLASAAATIVNEQFSTTRRFRSHLYDGKPKRLKDEITAPITVLQAIQKIEGRAC